MIQTQVLGSREHKRALLQLVKSTRAQVRAELNRAAKSTASRAKKKMPVAFGTLKASESIDYATNAKLAASVEFTAKHAQYVEGVHHNYILGRAPGRFPPLTPIGRWAILKGLPEKWFNKRTEQTVKQTIFLIQRKIATKGTKAKPFMKPAREEETPIHVKNMDRIISQAASQTGILLGRT